MAVRRIALRDIRKRRGRDILIIVVSVYFASILAQSGSVGAWLDTAMGNEILASFFAGVLFTSLFTIAPSAVALAQLMQESSFWVVSLAGAAGAVMGDLLLFTFVRDSVSEDLKHLLKGSLRKKILAQVRHPLLQWIVPVAGALIIASPLPDELGLAVLGLSKMRLAVLIPLSFAMNFLGIALIWFGIHAPGV